MNTRILFGTAAAFNFLVGLPMLVAYPRLAGMLGIDPTHTVWGDIAGAVVVMFGWVYWRIARDPVKYREYVILGVVGKLAFCAVIYAHWFAGTASGALALLVTVDLLYAIAFSAWLRTNPGRPLRGAT